MTLGEKVKIINARVYSDNFSFEKQDLFVKGELLSSPFSTDCIFDAQNLYAIPSLVDIHFHGAVGHDFMDGDYNGLKAISIYEASAGVGTIIPATMTMSEEVIFKALKNASAFKAPLNGADLEGIYLEGPFISSNKAGAQNPQYVRKADLDFFLKLQKQAHDLIKVLVIAPETENSCEFIKKVSAKVKVALGHTSCDYAKACEAIACGACELTHLYNAMNPLLHRSPGPIAAAALNENVKAELICDGIHVHEAMVKFAFKLFSKERIIMISDSMMAAGLSDGEYSLGGQKVRVCGKKATLEDGTLAGSVCNLFLMLKNAVSMGVPFEDAVRACTYNPALNVGILDKVGILKEGRRANILFLDDSLNLKGILHHGRWLKNLIYRS